MQATGTYKGEAQVEKRNMYFIDKAAYLQHKELELPYEPSSHDEQLTTFFTELQDETKYQTKITSMTRLQDYNDKGEMKEYLTWYESLSGLDKDGNSIRVSDIPCGRTKALIGIERFNGQVVPKAYPSRIKYTLEWRKEEAEKLIAKSEYKESIQYILKTDRNFSGFSKDEFLRCSFNQLEMRARLGVAGLYPSGADIRPGAPAHFQVIEQRGDNK